MIYYRLNKWQQLQVDKYLGIFRWKRKVKKLEERVKELETNQTP